MLRAIVPLLDVRPFNPLTVLSMGAVKFPAPIVANGVKLLSFQPSERSRRNSIPPLKACFPLFQLIVSPYVSSGLHEPRVAAKPLLNCMKPWGKIVGTTCMGMPLYCGSSFRASFASLVVGPPTSRCRATYHG